MNAFFTTLLLMIGSAIGYFAGMHLSGETYFAVVMALVGFIVALIVRLVPQAVGGMIDALN